MENFNQPYLSSNITTFWSRWHISLSTWFRDYVYIPLGGNRKGELRRRINVFIVFILSGLWHGANWTFVAWGSLHGVFVTLLRGKKTIAGKTLVNALLIMVNFALVTLLWVFFRSPHISDALQFLTGIFTLQKGSSLIGINNTEAIFAMCLIIVMLIRESKLGSHYIASNTKFALYVILMVVSCYFFGVFEENQFIYFQF